MVEMELTFKDKDENLVVIMPNVLARLMRYRQLHWYSLEAAGVLIGERRGPHLVIQDISEPGKGDIRSRYYVDRKGVHHQRAVELAFLRSGGTLQYIGEWHSHPEDEPSPSTKDRDSWNRYLSALEPMVLIIVGRKKLMVAKKEDRNIIPLTELV